FLLKTKRTSVTRLKSC
ncbi:tRNA synthetases class I (E and Q), catalytic domain protein, partial [Vibrio parahaemolyticus EKP-028]